MDPLAVQVSVLARDRPVLFHEGATRRSCSSVDNYSGGLGRQLVRVGSICPNDHQVRPPDKTSHGITRPAVAASFVEHRVVWIQVPEGELAIIIRIVVRIRKGVIVIGCGLMRPS
jgi:hypothetical protein